MRYLFWLGLLLVIFLSAIGSTVWADTAAESVKASDSLESPYFVDGLHCTGLNENEFSESWLVAKEEVDVLKKIDAQEDCETLFKSFGIEKYMWLNSDDLERISAKVRQSEYFEEASLSIKKSDMKNHVHAFLNVKTKSKYVYNLSFASQVQDSPAYGSRLFNTLSAEIVDRSLQPNSKNTWGFTFDLGLAATAMNTTLYFTDGTPSTVVSNDAFYNKNFYRGDVYYKYQRMLYPSFVWDFDAHLTLDNILTSPYSSQSAISSIAFSVDTDILYSKYIRFIRGTLFAGPALIYSPVERIGDPYSYGYYWNGGTLFLPGIKFGYQFGRSTGTYIRLEGAAYRTFALDQPDQILEGKQTIQFDLGKDVLLSFNSIQKASKGIVLSRDKSPSTDAMNNDSGIGLTKAFSNNIRRDEISLKLGFQTLNYSPYLIRTPYFYTQVGYRVLSDQLNIDLSFTYFPSRFYSRLY